MKILAITALPPAPFPEADHAFHVLDHLARRGHDVHAIAGRISVGLDSSGLSVYPVVEDWSWRDMPRIARILRRVGPDAVLVNYLQNVFNWRPMMKYSTALCKAVVPNASRAVLLPMPHWGRPIANPVKRAVRCAAARLAGVADIDAGLLLKDADTLIVLGEILRDNLCRFQPEVAPAVRIIAPAAILRISGPDGGRRRELERAALDIGSGVPVLGYFGYQYPGKGIETLLDAFSLVLRQTPEARLLVIGGQRDGYGEVARAYSQRLGLGSSVVWTGEYDWRSDQGSAYLRAVDVAVLPFDIGVQMNNSSVGAVVAHGLPLVTTRGDRLESPFVDGHNMLLVEPKNPPALAEAVLRVICDPALRESLSAGSRSLADNYYSWETVTTNFEEALRSRARKSRRN